MEETPGGSGRGSKMSSNPGAAPLPPVLYTKHQNDNILNDFYPPKLEYGNDMFLPSLSRPLTSLEVTDITSKVEIVGLPTSRDTDMRSLHSRYRSFRESNVTWPSDFQQRTVARAGFYYVGPGDRVRCFSCEGELEMWEPWDVPLTRHLRSFPHCPYVRGTGADRAWKYDQYPISTGTIMEAEGGTLVPPSSSCSPGKEPLGDMSDEYSRLETYRGHCHHFPHNNQRRLAQAGFYYVGPGDRVRCFSCRGELENWQPGYVPLIRHRLSFPDCPYVQEVDAKVPPIFAQSPIASASTDPRRSSSNCPSVQEVIKDQDHRQAEPITEGESDSSVPVAKSLGDMSDEYSRLETYQGHCHHFPHNNQQRLARAGFYYVGPEDRVRCFSCGGELENWEPGDVPLTRHRRAFPDCPHVRGMGAKTLAIISQGGYSDSDSSNELLDCDWDEHMKEKRRRFSPTVLGSSVTHGDKTDPPGKIPLGSIDICLFSHSKG
eukprot:XP_017952672.1 PREDICTED: baculoviral IAP repeat-containing protein 2-like [Xenopus tropicalis]